MFSLKFIVLACGGALGSIFQCIVFALRPAVLIGLALIAVLVNVEAQLYLGCFTETHPVPGYPFAGLVDNMTMTVKKCCDSCGVVQNNYCAISEISICQCGKTALTAAGTCGATCPADGLQCGRMLGFQDLDAYVTTTNPGGSSSKFILSVDIISVPLVVSVTISFNASKEKFYLNFGDGAPSFLGVGVQSPSYPYTLSLAYDMPFLPGLYSITAIGVVYGNQLGHEEISASFPIIPIASIDNLICPTIAVPQRQYLCNVSVTFTSYNHYYLMNFDDNPTVMKNLTTIGTVLHSFGPQTPKGPPEEAVNGTDPQDQIKLNSQTIDVNGQLVAFELLSHLASNISIFLLIPNCGSLNFCINLGICKPICSYDVPTKSYGCSPDAFCPLDSTCCTFTSSGVTPTWSQIPVLSNIGVSANTGRTFRLATPIDVEPGTVPMVVGSIKRSSVTRPGGGDIINGTPTNFTHYFTTIVKEFVVVPVSHTCVTAGKNVTFSVTDSANSTNTKSDITMCERNITDLKISINQTETFVINSKLPKTGNLYYVWNGYTFEILTIFSVAGPINFNITFTPTNGIDATVSFLNDYPNETGPYVIPLIRTIASPGVYIVQVVAFNNFNLEPDILTGKMQEGPMDNITIISQYPVSPSWTIVSDPAIAVLNSFIIPKNMPTFIFEDLYGLPFPTNASLKISWGDGSPNITTAFTDPGNKKPTFTHLYATKGVYLISCSLANFVSEVFFNITVTIYEEIVGFDAYITYSSILNPSSPNPAARRNTFLVPVNRNLSFVPMMTAGTVNSYELRFTNNDSLIGSYNVPDIFNPIVISHKAFSTAALINITFIAVNPFQRVPIYFLLEIGGQVRGLHLDDSSIVTKAGDLKTFTITFEGIGLDTCLVLNFGDLSESVAFGDKTRCNLNFSYAAYNQSVDLDFVMHVSHVYKVNNVYNITAIGYGNLNKVDDMLMFVVSNINCAPPVVHLFGQTVDFMSAQIVLKGYDTVLEAVSTISCTITQQTKKRWQIFSVNENTGAVIQPISVQQITPLTWNTSEFMIPKAYLNYGLYMVLFTITMWDPQVLGVNCPFQKQQKHYIYVDKTPLSTRLSSSGETKVIRGLDQSIHLEPAVYSVDPDFPSIKNFSIKWRCRAIGEIWPTLNTALPMTKGTMGTGCFGHGPGYVDLPYSDWEIFGRDFINLGTFEIEAQVTKDTRMSPVIIHIEVVPYPVPVIEVRCVVASLCVPSEDGKGVLVNPNDRIGLLLNCISSCEQPLYNYWLATYINDSAIKYHSGDISIGTSGNEFSLGVQFFTSHSDLKKMKLSAEVLNTGPYGSQLGASTYYMEINQKPVGGNCDLDKYTGKVIIDTFLLTCSGWVDPEDKGIQFYIVRLIDSLNSSTTLMERRNTDGSDQQLMPLVLPIGVFYIEIIIQDVWGAITIFDLPRQVTVTMISEEEFLKADTSLLVAKLLGGGDSSMLNMVLNARNAIIDQASWLSVSDPNITDAERESRMLQVNDMNSQTVSALKDSMNFLSPGSTEAASDVLAKMMLKASETPDSALTIDLFTRGDIYNILDKMVHQIGTMSLGTPEDLRKLLENIATISAGLVIGTEEITTPGCKRIPPKDYTYTADHVDYDTEVKSIDMTIPDDAISGKKCNIMDLTKSGPLGSSNEMPRLKSMMDKMNMYVLQRQVSGEIMNVPTKNNMTVVSGILPGGKGLAGVHYCGLSYIEFPVGLCPQGNCSLPVSLTIREWPTVTYISPDSADLLSRGTRVLEVTIYNRSSEPLNITDSKDVMKISLYRTLNKRGNATYPQAVFVNATYETQYQLIPIMYTKFNISKDGSALSIEVTPSNPVHERLFLLIKKGRLPTLQNYDNYTLVQDILPSENGSYTLFLSSLNVNGTGDYYIGIGEFAENITLQDARTPILKKANVTWLKKPMLVDYELRIKTCGCYFYDNGENIWSYFKMQTVGDNATSVRCDTNHLTSFGGGAFVMPNTIDFSYVFANMSFTDNLTIYITIIVCLTIFTLLMIWSRYQDRKDIATLGASPLPDNLANDKYLYEILVFTGSRKEAQTDSTVQFFLSGEFGDTDIRTFQNDQRKIFRKGGIDVFVMAVPKSLGSLSYLRIWHDNSGKGPNASWYLSYIVFRDIQTGQKYEFIYNDWLAVEKSDGQLETSIGVAGLNEKSEFGHMFPNISNKSLSDGHLWFSVFMRPPRSRFTRCQRAASCFALLFLSMLVNAMWYNTVKSQPGTGGLNIGPFNLSPEQISVGVMSNFIVFLPSFLITFLFRHAKPRKLRESRIQEALKKASRDTVDRIEGEKELSEQIQQEFLPQIPDFHKDLVQNSSKLKIKKKWKITLPWWCLYLAWILVAVSMVVSIFFLLSYGIMFGNDKTTKWLSALVVSFFSSVLLVQPFKVFLTAMFMSMVCKGADMDEDDADEDEESPALEKDELWLYDGERSKRLGYAGHNEDFLKQLRSKRLKEIEMWNIIMEIFSYSMFLWVLLIVSYEQRNPNAWYLKNNFVQNFIHIGAIDGTDYSTVVTTDDFWNYLPLGLMRPLRADTLYNGAPPYQLRGFLNDYANRIMGYAIIRQIRAKKNTCSVPESMKGMTTQCSGYSKLNEESSNFCKGWRVPTNQTQDLSACSIPEFRYETAAQLQSLPIWGIRDSYGGGGYVIHLSGSTRDILDRFTFLQESHWIDKMTRAILIEFSTYNPQINLFVISTIMAEITPGGGFFTSYRFDAISLLQSSSAFVIGCQVLFCIFIIYFTIRELRMLCKQKKHYFDSYWSYAEISIILVAYCAIILYGIRYYETDKAVTVFKDTYGNGYVRLTYAATINEIYGYTIAYLTFVGTLKFIKLLRFNKRMGFLAATLAKCWDELVGFMMAFCICFFAFVFMFYFIISPHIIDFSNIIGALETSFSMMMGKFQFNQLKEVNPMVPVMFFIFVLCTSWVLVNLLLTLIIKSFEQVKRDIMKQSNDYEIIDFVFAQFKKFIRQSADSDTLKVTPNLPEDKMEEELFSNDVTKLPSKIDEFLNYVNDVYFDGTLDIKSKEAMRGSCFKPTRRVLGNEMDSGVDNVGFGTDMDFSAHPFFKKSNFN